VGIIKTDSRGGFLGLVAVVMVLMLQIKTLEKRGLFGILIILLVLIIGFLQFADEGYLDRLSTMLTPSKDYNMSSSTGRLQIWQRGIEMMIMNPVLGVGVFNFMTADGVLFAEAGARYQAAHNSFVQIGAELGVPGFIAFCLLFWRTIKHLRIISSGIIENGSAPTQNTVIAYSVIGAFAGFLVSGFFLSAAYISSLYFLFAMSVSILSANHVQSSIARSEKVDFFS